MHRGVPLLADLPPPAPAAAALRAPRGLHLLAPLTHTPLRLSPPPPLCGVCM
jgi:hypothetical protein